MTDADQPPTSRTKIFAGWGPKQPSMDWAKRHHPTVSLPEVTEHFILWCREKERDPEDSTWRTFISNDSKRLAEIDKRIEASISKQEFEIERRKKISGNVAD